MKLILYIILFNFFYTICCSQKGGESNINLTSELQSVKWRSLDSLNYNLFDDALSIHTVIVLTQNSHDDTLDLREQCKILQKLIETRRINKLFIEASGINIRIIDSFFRVNGKKNIKQIGRLLNTNTLRFWKSNRFIEFVAEQVNQGNLNLFGIDIAGIDAEIVGKLFNEAISIPSVKHLLSTNSEAKYSIKEAYRYFSGLNEFSTYPYELFLIQNEFINEIVNYYGSKGEYIKVQEWNLIRLYFKWLGVRSDQEKIGYTYVSKPRSIFEATKFHTFRDSSMAEIFADYFKSVEDPYKSVVLVSAYHSLQNPADISGINDCCVPKSVKIFGQILKEKYSIHFYNVGFIVDDKVKVNISNGNAKNERKQVGKPILSMPRISGFVLLNNITESEYYLNFLFNKSFLSNWKKNFAILFFLTRQ